MLNSRVARSWRFAVALATPVEAGTGAVPVRIVKLGFIIGAGGGEGVLTYRGRASICREVRWVSSCRWALAVLRSPCASRRQAYGLRCYFAGLRGASFARGARSAPHDYAVEPAPT
jgi:hypothetical protein